MCVCVCARVPTRTHDVAHKDVALGVVSVAETLEVGSLPLSLQLQYYGSPFFSRWQTQTVAISRTNPGR